MVEPARAPEKLHVQVLHNPGARLPAEVLQPPSEAERAAGRASFAYLGDLQLRLVVDEGDGSAPEPLRADQLATLGMPPTKALALAAMNTRKRNGPPIAVPLAGGVSSLRGQVNEAIHGYLLDRAFWRAELAKAPQGVLAALPRKGVLLFAPAGEMQAMAHLIRQARTMVAAAGPARISDCIYRFDAKGWHLHAELPKAAPAAGGTVVMKAGAAPPEPEVDEETSEEARLDAADALLRRVAALLAAGVVLHVLLKAPVPALLTAVVATAVTLYGLRLVLRGAAHFGHSTAATIGQMVANFVPLLNLATWAFHGWQAARQLRAGGRALRWPWVRA